MGKQMYSVNHGSFLYMTTDLDLVVERAKQGYQVALTEYLQQPWADMRKATALIADRVLKF